MNAGIVHANILPGVSDRQVSSKNSALGRDDFLKLLVTQLRYQNPLDPMGNEAFIAQSAQFSALEATRDMSENVKALVELQKSASRTAALGWIGKDVSARQSTIALSENSPADLTYSLSADADVTVTIHNTNGVSVRTIETGEQLSGDHTYTWDGRNDDGILMPSGEYTYKVAAVDAAGNEVAASGIISGIVDGLIFGDEAYVSIGGTRVPLSAVTEVLSKTVEE